MNHWLYPANVKLYDVVSAFSEPTAFWPINTKVELGDTVFLYLSAPHKQVGFECEVLEIGLLEEAIFESVRQYFKKVPDSAPKKKSFMNLKVARRINLNERSLLSFQCLKHNGLNGALMGPRKLDNNPELLNYIRDSLNEL